MRIESKVHLEDIRIAAEETLQFIAGKTFSDYRMDRMFQVAVEQEFEIIGEALRRRGFLTISASFVSETG